MLLSYSEGDAFSSGLCVEYTSHHLSNQCSRVEQLLPLFRVFVLLRSVLAEVTLQHVCQTAGDLLLSFQHK